ILGDWRRGEAFLRDYYRVEDEKGRRYWLFRQGLYETAGYADTSAEEDSAPTRGAGQVDAAGRPGWYIHGVFG
ncbi:MAG: hypothetical protein HC871_06710, partial [Rhizobiales bacterium]|nr:hypothetical protein [Hyphomicrobiales bacterium]